MTHRAITVTEQLPVWLAGLGVIIAALGAVDDVRGADMRLSGSAAAIWAYQPGGPPAAPVLRFARATPDDRGVRFRPLPPLATGGLVQLVGARGPFLHLFFADGSHYRLVPPSTVNPPPTPLSLDTPEIRLPGNAIPLACGGSHDGDRLLALVTARVGVGVHDDAWRRAQDGQDAAVPGDPPADEAPADVTPPAFAADSSYALVAYERGVWAPVSPLPPAVQSITRCWLVDGADGSAVVYATDDSAGQLALLTWRDERWSTGAAMPPIDAGHVLAVADLAGELAILHHDATGADTVGVVRSTVHRDASWQRERTLTTPLGDLTVDRTHLAADRLADRWIVAWTPVPDATVDGSAVTSRLRVGGWPADGGPPAAPVDDLVGLTGVGTTPAGEQTRLVIVTLVLTGTLTIIFLRRRDCFLSDFPPPPGYVLAGLGRRSLAFALDLLVVTPVIGGFVVGPWLMANDVRMGAAMSADVEYLLARDPYAFYWRWLLSLAIFMLYAIILEATAGGTLGKLALRLRVSSSTGQRPALKDVILRNLLRFELYYRLEFIPVAILVALTRNRQRLGDLVARTIVVQKTATTVTPPAQS